MTASITRSIIGVIAAVILASGIVAGAAAQDATPAASDEQLPNLAHINQGSCEELSHIVHKLEDVAPVGGDAATPAAVASPVAAVDADRTSTTTVEVALDDLLADPHAINIHASIEAVDSFVACGNISGSPLEGEVAFEIAELNGSGLSGAASLTDNGDGTTTVTIVLEQGEPGTPEATPVS